MVIYLLVAVIFLSAVTVGLLLILILRRSNNNLIQLEGKFAALEKTEKDIKDEIAKNREESSYNAKQGREEIAGLFTMFKDDNGKRLDSFLKQLDMLTQSNENKLDNVRRTVDEKLRQIQDDNSKKLEQIRLTVDEKLHATLEKRLGESFQLVSERLESVHKGLGEMQTLASGVGDLKKVLTNIKTRGIWGEFQLGALLEQILTPDQFARNVVTKPGSNERVEFAIKLPGRGTNNEEEIWLPIDAKFPKEDYERLIDAQDQSDMKLADDASKKLEIRIKAEAKDIKEKYIDPPNTTDFGIMFLPFESLYAEVLRRPGLCDTLQKDYRVVITGPSTLAALLNSLQMGFRTLAIEKRSSEVWSLLGVVKTEFGNFGTILEKTHKKLQEASNTIESASRKSRTIERKLRDVQELPTTEEELPVVEGAGI